MALVYRHRRLDNFTIFYVGIELDSINKTKLGKRPYIKQGKSKWWKNITNKTEYIVEIVSNNLTDLEAIELEILLIKEYGRADLNKGLLVNHTNGGEGITGFKHSKTTLLKMSNSAKGRVISEKTRLKLSMSKKGKKKPNLEKKVIDLKNKVIYDCISQVCEKYKINKSTLRNKLNGFKYNNTDFIYLENYTDCYIKPKKILKEYSNYKKVICLTTLKIWKTTTEASVELGIKRTTLLRSLQNLNKINNYQYYNN